jgi:hypothetical protein
MRGPVGRNAFAGFLPAGIAWKNESEKGKLLE